MAFGRGGCGGLRARGRLAAWLAVALVLLLPGHGLVPRVLSAAGCTRPLPDAAADARMLAADGELLEVPAYDGDLVVSVGDGLADFGADEGRTDAFEAYAPLDDEGRCGTAFANVCEQTMPDVERGPIGDVRPSGWRQARYGWVDGEYLYNRCHLIAYRLTGENANERNLVTGTRTMNARSMVPYEDEVAEHVADTGHHVLFRATPVFEGDDEVCRGVRLEARCVEGDGELSFDVFCHNVEPGVTIDYATGDSEADGTVAEDGGVVGEGEARFVVNTRSRRFHRPGCPGLEGASDANLEDFWGRRSALVAEGLAPCGVCDP